MKRSVGGRVARSDASDGETMGRSSEVGQAGVTVLTHNREKNKASKSSYSQELLFLKVPFN